MSKKKISPAQQQIKEAEHTQQIQNEWWSIRHILSYWYMMMYILLGARERGKSYAVTEYFVKQYKKKGIPFYWLRLTEKQTLKLKQNRAEKLVDADIRRKYNLDLIVEGDNVYDVTREKCVVTHKDGSKTTETKIVEKRLFAHVYAVSTFYNDKGSIFDKDFLNDPNMQYLIACDEFEKEKGERNTFDLLYCLVNQLENLIRSTKDRVKIFFIGNTLEECSELLCALDFIPERNGIFQLVRNKKKLIEYLTELKHCRTDQEKQLVNKKYYNYDWGKRTVIENIQNSEAYNIRRKGTIADILMPKASTFTNKIDTDDALLFKGALTSPSYIVKFTKDPNDWFTVWNKNVITKWKGEKKSVRAMRPYLDEVFNVKIQQAVIEQFDTRCFLFRNLITFKQFQNQLALLKPRKG